MVSAVPVNKMCTMFLKLFSYKFPAQLQISNGKCLSMQQETRFHCDGFLLDSGGWNMLWNCDHNLVGKHLKLGPVNMHSSCKRANGLHIMRAQAQLSMHSSKIKRQWSPLSSPWFSEKRKTKKYHFGLVLVMYLQRAFRLFFAKSNNGIFP
jgi:hypothetical protein